MSWSGSNYDSASNDQDGSRTIMVKTQTVAADGMLAIPDSTICIHRSASTGARPRRGDVKVIHQSKTRSRSRSRSRSPERGRTLHYDGKIYSRAFISRSRGRNPQAEITVTRLEVNRPTYIKVHRKYLSPDTLDAYNLPWKWDSDTNYIIIKQCISYDYQEALFAHTRRIRESTRPTTDTVTTTKITTVTSNDQDRNSLCVVVKKDRSPSGSPGRTTVVYKKEARTPSRSPRRTTFVYT